MRKLLLFSAIAGLFIACSSNADNTIHIKNPSEDKVLNKPFVISRLALSELISFIPEGKVPVIKDTNGVPAFAQVDDLDKDGQWDEIALVMSFLKNETKVFEVSFVSKEEAPKHKVYTAIRFARKSNLEEEIYEAVRLKTMNNAVTQAEFQMEGPAWENDKVGFRNYFDGRNGIDIFGKTTNEMVLAEAGINGQDYHHLDSWGMDILKVGNSLGAGAIGLMIKDTIIAVGNQGKGTFKRITEGPVRSIISFQFDSCDILGNIVSVQHDVIIWAHSYGYESKVIIDGAQEGDLFVTGIVNLHDLDLIEDNAGNFSIMATHGVQSLNDDVLGMALFLKKSQMLTKGKIEKEEVGVTDTYYGALRIEEGKTLNYWFLACWEKSDEGFKEKKYFLNNLRNAANNYSIDLIIE